MKTIKSVFIATVAVGTFAISGCAYSPFAGTLYTGVKMPTVDLEVQSSESAGSSKKGTASCKSILGLVALGDCSVEAAMKDGGIKKVHHVDYENKNILGIVNKGTFIVYGE